MFCPKCSQQQISDNVRFCSRCGFQLNVVKALLGNDDAALLNIEPIASNRPRRKKDMMIGAVLMGVFALHTAWTTEDLSLEGKYTGIVIKCFLLCVLINVMPFIRDYLYSRIIQNGSSSPNVLPHLVAKFKNEAQHSALPSAYSRPAADYFAGRTTTAELVPPPSITEDTTSLLRNRHN